MFGSFSLVNTEKSNVKSGIDNEDCRKKRQEVSVQIRKNKREDNLRKRRMCGNQVEESQVEAKAEENVSSPKSIVASMSNIHVIKDAMMNTNNFEDQLAGTRALRKLLSQRVAPPVQQIVDAGFLPLLCHFLQMNDQAELQFEAAWALTNIGSSDLTYTIYDAGVLPLLVPLLVSEDPKLREQAAWCIGNIAGDCTEYRDAVLHDDKAVEGLLLNIVHPSSQCMLRNVTWTVSNLCRGNKPPASLKKLEPIIPVLKNLIEHCQDEETLVDACWAVSYISDGSDDRIEAIVNSGMCSHLVRLLADPHKLQTYTAPCLRALGNIVTGSDNHTQTAIEAGLLNVFPGLLESYRATTRKEAAWACSNVAAGTKAQVAALLAVPRLPEALVTALSSGEWAVQKEAAWTIANICSGGTSDNIRCIVEKYNVLGPVCELLSCHDPKIVGILLKALDSMLRLGGEDYARMVEECNGIEMLESLQNHQDDSIYEKARGIIESYFSVEDDDENIENLMPSVEGNQFAFKTFDQVPEQNFFSNNPAQFNFTF